MRQPQYIILGRSSDCDVVLSDRSVSGRHARLSWSNGKILIEDLGSANGTFVRGKRVDRATARPGDDVRFGQLALRWTDRRLKPFLRSGGIGDTVMGMALPHRRFICGACGARGVLPERFKHGEVSCGACGARLTVGSRRAPTLVWIGASAFAVITLLVIAWAWPGQSPDAPLRRAAEQLGLPRDPFAAALARSPQEAAIRSRVAPRIVEAIDSTSPLTRTTAARIAAGDEGPFHLEQVARIWTAARSRWRYVNDPRGDEYFARASETIRNEYVGDCDDFAIVLAGMISAIGGEARIVMMDGPRGGHAYAEACIPEQPEVVARKLATHYRRRWDRFTGGERVENIAFRTSAACPVWLNLDWVARVPGGRYEPEVWAVAIYTDGRTETLGPATPASSDPPRPSQAASTPPR